MRTVAQLLVTFLLNAAWQIAVITAVAVVCAWLLRPTAPWQRHAVWVAALVLSLGLPLASCLLLVKSLQGSAPEPTPIAAAPINIAPITSVQSEAAEPTEKSASPSRVAPSQPTAKTARQSPSIFQRGVWISPVRLNSTLATVLVGLYAMSLSYRSVKLLRAWRRTRTIIRGAYSVSFPDRIQKIIAECQAAIGCAAVRIVCSTAVPVPITAGVFHHVIILPERLLREADKDVLSSAIGHELVHVARRDYILNLLYELIYLPLSFHPGAALLWRRIRQTRELCCDDLVAKKLLRPDVYARSLVRLIGWAPLAGRLDADTTIGITDADILEIRIMSLLAKPKLSTRRRTLLLITASLLLITPCVAAASFAIRFDINGPEPVIIQQQDNRRETRQELQRAREELKRQERELKEQLRKNPNLQGPELEALHRMERELQEAAVKLREEEAQQSGQDRERVRQEIQEKLAEIEAQYPGDEARMREAKQKIAEMEKLYPKDRMREVQEAIAQMEKNRPENEARLREAQAQMALMEKLYQNDERGMMIHHVEPKYSEDARDKKIEGTVILSATIDPNGLPQDIQVTKPLFPSLDANAVEALRQSRFRPYMKDGQPISKRITVEMHFSVNDGQKNKLKEREREKQDKEREKADEDAKLKDKVFEMRMRKDRVESGREERARKQVEMTRGATISMDRAIQIATSQYPGKVLACSLGREQDGQVFYHLVIINAEGEKSTTRYVWISATDGHIIKTENEDR
ncbi:MAG TPA: TonB family protein [Pyrinomonadaceae bacterium]